MLFQNCLFFWGGVGRRDAFPAPYRGAGSSSAHPTQVSPARVQVHPHFCARDEAQALFKQTAKRPGETERLSCPRLNSFLCPKWRAELIRGSRSNYRQGLGSADAWVNSDCSFHPIPNRNNNAGIVLRFSLRGFGEGARLW